MAEIVLNDLIREYGTMVSSISRKMLRDEELAKDAAQEVWLQVIKSLPGFRADSGVSTWIYTIARRVVSKHAHNERIYSIRFLRDYFHQGDLEVPFYEEYDKKLWIKEMCDKCLTGVLHCLDNESRLIFLFRDVAGLPYDHIAVIFSQDKSAVRQTVSRCRKKLRNFLKDECMLFNPAGKCRCRMKNLVAGINLAGEYEKLRRLVGRVNLFLESEKILPAKNYWETFLIDG